MASGIALDHGDRPAESLCDVEDAVGVGCPQGVAVAMSLLADHDDAARQVPDEGERPPLGPGRDDLERLSGPVELLEFRDKGRVPAGADLTRTKRVVEIADRVVDVEPSAVVVDEV